MTSRSSLRVRVHWSAQGSKQTNHLITTTCVISSWGKERAGESHDSTLTGTVRWCKARFPGFVVMRKEEEEQARELEQNVRSLFEFFLLRRLLARWRSLFSSHGSGHDDDREFQILSTPLS